jgi:hypothetical protein
MADPKSKIVKGGLSAAKRLLMTEEEKLAQKYAAGAQYADPLAPATMRMSEALGNVGAEGKTLNFTEADRSRVFGSNRGGVGFSGLQHYSLPHKNANTVWGFGNKTTADKKVKQNDPEKTIWTTFVGAPDQHKSNTVVLKDAMKEFQDAVKAGKVSPAQIKLMNDRIRLAKEEKTGSLLFDDAYDLTDPQALSGANTFSRRSAVGDVLLGTGVKGPMRRKAFKEENKGETWKDAGQMDAILKRETDPDLVDAETFEVGNRLFVLDNGIIHRPDLNEAFPVQVTGTDLGLKYQLTPKEKAMRDWMKQYEGRVDKKGRPAPASYMDLSRNNPSQFVDEDFLTFLQKEGYKKGGAVDIKQSDARLNAAIANRMAKGGKVDIKAADARLAQAMAQRMAQGGQAGLKKLEFMAEGGPAFKTLQFKAEGGSAFKTLQFKEPQHFDGGGIASPEESSGYSAQPFMSGKRWSDIKKNAAEMWDETKKTLGSDYERLKSSPRARAQLAKIAGMQLAGGAPDLAHLGVDLIVDPLKSVTVDKLLTKPAYRSVLEGPPKAGEKQERVPMFGSISDALKTEDGLPIGGSEHLIKRAQDAGLMSQGRFHPLTEIPAAIAGGLGVSKLGKVASKGYQKNIEPRVDPAGALSRAITDDSNSLLPSFTKNPLYAPQSVKLTGLQPEVKTASTGTPQGATYATKQEGPFYRVSPTTLDVSGAKSRGLREADELQGQAPVGGTAGEAGREVPLRISDEEVARLIADPASNQPLQIAQRFTKETQGTDFVVPEISESSLAKQSAIGRAHQLAVEGSPEYKSAVFDAYAKQMPDLLEQVGAKNYDDLMEKAYRQLAKETDEQFKQLPYNFSYHRAGEGDYKSSKEMMADVHGNKHLYVFQGGDPHDFLNRLDKASGLNENEKFRAVHDLLGHAIYGNQFGPKGEEIAWAIHQQMYSPLARLAMTAETRGQNSLVNYSPLNVSLKTNIAKLEDLEVEALRRKDTALVNEIRAAKRQEFANNFQFAPQKAVLLPPEFVDPKFAGGLPDYLSAANRPAKGTESQSVLTHFSNSPDLQFLDPTRYGTGIKGAEAERLREYAGGVKDRSYVYLGEPGTVSPESGLGVNRYRGESQNLYDITKDPLGFRPLARESNRTPFTAKYNAGITHPLQEANDYERLVKEYGYEGMINPNASKPMGIMFKPTPVQPRKRGGLTQLKAR